MKFINKIFPLFATTLLILNSTSSVLALSGDRNENVHEEQKNEVPISQDKESKPKDLVEVEILEGKGAEDTEEEETSYETQTHGTWGGVDWIFTGTKSLWLTTSGKLGDMSQAPWVDPKTGIKPEDIESVKIVTSVSTGANASKLFSLPNVTEITGLEKLDTRATTQMSYMFAGSRVSQLDLSAFNTSKVSTMTHMFDGAKELRKLNLSSFDTNKSPFMDGMFTGTTLTHLTLGKNFRFRKDADLGSPIGEAGEETTGNWVRDDYQTKGTLQ
ncbi:hypothetical protein ikelab_09480 [Lactococcus garvieae]|uniref:BspA family leucine-rich repeat surface protein n=1 Tax=Lactococcus garvieae TaxID=1363 RepID=A0A6L2ZU67_9LACT|nr:BspA family leucine-rich repeat surface protein [Lactococcus garvieae]GFO51673.1 hypothetical protein ikelab_09480 [Lactococcus garvieae]